MWREAERVRLSLTSAQIRRGVSREAVRSHMHRGSRDKAAGLSGSPWSVAQGSEADSSQPCLLAPIEGTRQGAPETSKAKTMDWIP